jgi:hypothetical protein
VIQLRTVFTVDIGGDALITDIVALPGARAAALVSRQNGSSSIALVDGGGALSWSLADVEDRPWGLALCRLGEGFALVSDRATIRWSRFDSAAQNFAREDPFPANKNGFKVGIQRGGLCDDPGAALLFLHEPQTTMGTTRFALLRFDEATATARWDWTDAAGEPPWLYKEDFPIPDEWQGGYRLFDKIRPFLDHGSWVAGRLRLFALGSLTGNFIRWGMDYSIAAVVEERRVVAKWAADEPSWGRFTSSGRHLLLRPLRANGATKGASRLLEFETGEIDTIKPPRGLAGFRPADEHEGTFWLTHNKGWTSRIAACSREIRD